MKLNHPDLKLLRYKILRDFLLNLRFYFLESSITKHCMSCRGIENPSELCSSTGPQSEGLLQLLGLVQFELNEKCSVQFVLLLPSVNSCTGSKVMHVSVIFMYCCKVASSGPLGFRFWAVYICISVLQFTNIFSFLNFFKVIKSSKSSLT
jgi:hypothetical protein